MGAEVGLIERQQYQVNSFVTATYTVTKCGENETIKTCVYGLPEGDLRLLLVFNLLV